MYPRPVLAGGGSPHQGLSLLPILVGVSDKRIHLRVMMWMDPEMDARQNLKSAAQRQ
jgi:hypothetical protein